MQLTKKAGLMAILLSLLYLVALCGIAGAATVTIGAVSGAGAVVVDNFDQPTGAYSFYGGFTWAPPFNDPLAMNDLGQYTFAANSAGTVPAYDSDLGANPIFRGNYQWVLNNTTGTDNATLYGSVVNFNFSKLTDLTGTFTGTVQSSDGFIHWYYGHDGDTVPLPGMTPLSAYNLSDTFNISGSYVVTGWNGETHTAAYSFQNAIVTATVVPLPSTVLLLGSGLVGLAFYRRRRAAKG